MSADDGRFVEEQRRAFAAADERHFAWQTGNPLVASTEQALLGGVLSRPATRRLLEVGSGEGANLLNLRASAGWLPPLTIGLDLFAEKVRFGQAHASPARFVRGDALALPFASGSIDLVLCRDVLHHLPDRLAGLREIRRVCRAGGEVVIVEPNGRNPLIASFALAMRHERGQLWTSPARLQRLAESVFGHVEMEMRQPLPLSRALVHYGYGFPRLGGKSWFARLMAAWDASAAVLLPRRCWAYIVLRIDTLR